MKPSDRLYVFAVRGTKKPKKESLAFITAPDEPKAVEELKMAMNRPGIEGCPPLKDYEFQIGAEFSPDDLANIFSPASLDPISTSAALRYAALEHEDILSDTERYTLNSVSNRIINKYFNE